MKGGILHMIERSHDLECNASNVPHLRTSSGIRYETIKDLADRTKMSVSWWYGQTRKTGQGTVPRIKKGKYILFVPEEVDAWLKNQTN